MMHALVFGGRDFTDWNTLYRICDQHLHIYDEVEIISGLSDEECIGKWESRKWEGADFWAWSYSIQRKHRYRGFAAEWGHLHKAAGPIRNRAMGDYLIQFPGEIIAIGFWDGRSRGTADMIRTLKKLEKATGISVPLHTEMYI